MVRIALVLIALLVMVAPARGQLDWVNVDVTTICNGSDVVLTVTLNLTAAIPPEFTHWALEREVVGECAAVAQVGQLRQFPGGASQQFFITDVPDLPQRKNIYRVLAVDNEGGRTHIPFNQSTQFAQEDCGGPAARGKVVEVSPGNYRLQVCEGQCWWQMTAMEDHLPEEAPLLVGNTIDIWGELVWGLHGPGIVISQWTLAIQPCTTVSTQAQSWGQVKATFR